jgi:phosphoribosylaminoimidazolecarboxamide formyltransferase / IMP cyclohydrolase
MRIRTALVSVFDKTGLTPLLYKLDSLGVELISTGGTHDFILSLGLKAARVEDLTGYPGIFGGRVKTLHPMVFGGILQRRNHPSDKREAENYGIPSIDMVIVDLYPFEDTVASGASDPEIIEKIDIGGISLIRASAKNHQDVLIVPSREYYAEVLNVLETGGGEIEYPTLRSFAMRAFDVSAHYDAAIHAWFLGNEMPAGLRIEAGSGRSLRYGENPHQKGVFYGKLDEIIRQLHGKELSYNNLLDIDAAVQLISDFEEPTVAILKHNNACGLASRPDLRMAWNAALAADPVSAYGGIIITNRTVDTACAEGIDTIFCEVLIAPAYHEQALEILKRKKNRIILELLPARLPGTLVKSALNGYLSQERDTRTETLEDIKPVSNKPLEPGQIADLLFANIIVKHTKSNAIVLVKDKQLLASGTGQTSRVDALRQAIAKAQSFGFDLQGAAMASDAFFPFADSIEIAHQAGINAVIQPGGSIRDQESIDYCNQHGIAMAFTGIRHFKH